MSAIAPALAPALADSSAAAPHQIGPEGLHIGPVSVSFGTVQALEAVEVVVRPGEILGLVGPNGAGKSTLLRVIAGCLRPDGDRAPVRHGASVGYAPEQPAVHTELTVADQLRFAARLAGVPRRTVREAVGSAVERAGLSGMERRVIATLSKGYRQRVGLAQAFVGEPPILLLDEPTSGMDPNQVTEFHRVLATGAESRFVIYSSHRIAEVSRIADRVAILVDGRLGGLVECARLREPWYRATPGDGVPAGAGTFPWFATPDRSTVFAQSDGFPGEPVHLDLDAIFAMATRQ